MTTPNESVDLIDSLPYYDRQLEEVPGLREEAVALRDAELKKSGLKSSHPRMAPAGEDLFAKSPALSSLLASYPSQPLAALDMSRYSLPGPSSANPTPEEWAAAVDNARVQVQYTLDRQTNLSLLQAHGPNANIIHNHLLEKDASQLEKSVEVLKEQVTEVNRTRKATQLESGAQLSRLEARWTELISSTLQAEIANAALEAEVEGLKRRQQELLEAA